MGSHLKKAYLLASFANVFNVTKKEMRKATWMRTIGKQMKPFHQSILLSLNDKG